MGGKKKKGLFGGVKLPKIKVGKDLGLKAVGKAVGNVGKAVTKGVKDVAKTATKAVGDTTSQVGRTVGSKDIVNAGKNVTREAASGINQYGDLAANIGLSALTGGAYGAVNSLGNMASSGKFDLGGAASAVGSLAGLNPTNKTLSAA